MMIIDAFLVCKRKEFDRMELQNKVEKETLNSDQQAFKDLTQEMLELFISKNDDYGNAFFTNLNELGIIAGVSRINEKTLRILSLTKQEAKVKDESMIDSLKDLANYAIMLRIWLEGGGRD